MCYVYKKYFAITQTITPLERKYKLKKAKWLSTQMC